MPVLNMMWLICGFRLEARAWAAVAPACRAMQKNLLLTGTHAPATGIIDNDSFSEEVLPGKVSLYSASKGR